MSEQPRTALLASDSLLPQLDAVGAFASFACAVHCAAMPILLTTLPLAGLEILANHRLEQGFVVLASIFSFVVIGSGYCRHRLPLVAVTYVCAVGALLVGAFLLHGMGAVHAATLAGGGVLLGCAHALNRRGVMRHGCARTLFNAASRATG